MTDNKMTTNDKIGITISLLLIMTILFIVCAFIAEDGDLFIGIATVPALMTFALVIFREDMIE